MFEISLQTGRTGRRSIPTIGPSAIVRTVEFGQDFGLEDRTLLSAVFLSQSVTSHAVFTEGTSFTQQIKIKNTDSATWSGFHMVRVGGDSYGGGANAVAVPTTAYGQTATINLVSIRKGMLSHVSIFE